VYRDKSEFSVQNGEWQASVMHIIGIPVDGESVTDYFNFILLCVFCLCLIVTCVTVITQLMDAKQQ